MALIGGRYSPTRGPGLKGRLMVDVVRGRVRVRAWPKKRKRPLHPQTVAQNQKFKDAAILAKYTPAEIMNPMITATRGTPFYPRDLVTMTASGRFAVIDTIEGISIMPSPAQSAVSESLDAIAQLQGEMLVRSDGLWVPIVPGQPGHVLTTQGLGSLPTWEPQSGGGGNLTPPLLTTFPTWVNQGNALAVESPFDALEISGTGEGSGAHIQGRVGPIAGAGNKHLSLTRGIMRNELWNGTGLMLRNSADGKLITFTTAYSTGDDEEYIRILRWNSPTSADSVAYSQSYMSIQSIWFRIDHLSDRFEFFISAWGGSWRRIHSELKTTFIGSADEIGIGARVNNLTNAPWAMASRHWSVEAI